MSGALPLLNGVVWPPQIKPCSGRGKSRLPLAEEFSDNEHRLSASWALSAGYSLLRDLIPVTYGLWVCSEVSGRDRLRKSQYSNSMPGILAR